MEEHPQGGFHGLLEVIPTKADYLLDLIRANSLWPLLSGLSCCAIEMMSTATSVNDIDRFGMFPFRASPRQADVLIVAGTLTTKMAGPLVRLWEQMPEPKWCVAMGTCTTSGGRFKRSYSVVQGVDRVMPVDVYVPGCPPRPEGLIYGMMKLHELVKQRRGQWQHVRRPRPAAHALGRRRALTAPVAAGALVRLLTERLGRRPPRPVDRRGHRRVPRSMARAPSTSCARCATTRTSPSSCWPMPRPSTTASDERFEVVYHLFSWKHPAWLRVRAHVDRADPAHRRASPTCGRGRCSTSARCTT